MIQTLFSSLFNTRRNNVQNFRKKKFKSAFDFYFIFNAFIVMDGLGTNMVIYKLIKLTHTYNLCEISILFTLTYERCILHVHFVLRIKL